MPQHPRGPASAHPFPSTLRIQKEAILPNRFRADVRECFLIVSGYGDLSSERAYLRGETFSCVREDGGVIEAKLMLMRSVRTVRLGFVVEWYPNKVRS